MRAARAAIFLICILMASLGGVVAYRAAFVEPPTGVAITEEGVREMHSTPRIVSGLALLLVGAALAFVTARRR